MQPSAMTVCKRQLHTGQKKPIQQSAQPPRVCFVFLFFLRNVFTESLTRTTNRHHAGSLSPAKAIYHRGTCPALPGPGHDPRPIPGEDDSPKFNPECLSTAPPAHEGKTSPISPKCNLHPIPAPPSRAPFAPAAPVSRGLP